MARFGSCLRKKNRAESNVSPCEEDSPAPCSKIGVFWEFSYFYYDKQTGNFEKVDACHAVPNGAQIELRLNVKCKGENQSTVEQPFKKKNVHVEKGKMNLKWRKYGRTMLHYTLEARTRNKRLKTSMYFWIELTELRVVTAAQDIFLQHLFLLYVILTWLSLHRMALKKRVITDITSSNGDLVPCLPKK